MSKVNIILLLAILFFGVIQSDQNSEFLDETYHSGVFQINENSEMFYWLFESKQSPETDPLMININGILGASSLGALFYMNGPFSLNEETSTLEPNPYSWNKFTNIMYIDSPVGVGFSKSADSELRTNVEQVAEDFMVFLEKFYEKFQNYKNNPLILSGVSFVGESISAIAEKILTYEKFHIKLVGIAIGNGWFDPLHQIQAQLSFSEEYNLLEPGDNKQFLQRFVDQCLDDIKQGNKAYLIQNCQSGQKAIEVFFMNKDMNIYDIRQTCKGNRYCFDFSPIINYLNRSDIQKLLKIDDSRRWELFSDKVFDKLSHEKYVNSSPKISNLLKKGIRVLIYYGDQDFKCNWRGGEKWTNEIEWDFKEEFKNKPLENWKEFGQLKTVNNLTFVRIFQAGHVAPRDQPQAAFEMISAFLKEQNIV